MGNSCYLSPYFSKDDFPKVLQKVLSRFHLILLPFFWSVYRWSFYSAVDRAIVCHSGHYFFCEHSLRLNSLLRREEHYYIGFLLLTKVCFSYMLLLNLVSVNLVFCASQISDLSRKSVFVLNVISYVYFMVSVLGDPFGSVT